MKKQSWAKIVAFLALFWILIWVVWTWILIIFSWNNTSINTENNENITREDLQKIINNSKTVKSNTLTWTKNK